MRFTTIAKAGTMQCLPLEVAAWILLGCFPTLAQVTIKNPQHLEVPQEKVQVLFSTACQVVAEEFHLRKAEFPLTLVLGDPNERYTADEEHRAYTIYLDHWNEAEFAASAMRLAIQRMVPLARRNRMVLEILRRSDQIATVSVSTFKKVHK